MPLTLALDPSLAETGFAVLDLETGHIVISGSIPISRRLPEQKRLATLATATLRLIRRHKPTEVAIERPFVGQNRLTALTLGAVRGILLYLGEQRGLLVHEYSASQVKSAMTSVPTATKAQVQVMIQRLTSLSVTNHNESDAIAVGLTHLRVRRAPRPVHVPRAIRRRPSTTAPS